MRAKTIAWEAKLTPLAKRLAPLITHSSPSSTAVVSIQVASLPWSGSVRLKANSFSPEIDPSSHSLLLRLGAELLEDQREDEVADHRGLHLQVVVQPEPLRRQVVAQHRHAEVGAVVPTHPLRQRVAEEAGRVRPPAHLLEQLDPLLGVDAVVLPIGPLPLAAVVEELHVFRLERFDVTLDEGIEVADEVLQLLG